MTNSIIDSTQPDFESLQQAAEWFALLRSDDVTAEDKEAWAVWLAAAPAHQAAWARIAQVSQQFEPLQQKSEQALAALKASRAVPVKRRAFLNSVLGLGGLGLVGWGTWRYTPLPQTLSYWRADYRTAIGEVKALDLSDGTKIWLSATTAVDVHYSAEHRKLRLRQGEILIKTAPDSRPFIVKTEHGQLEPLGTEFSVRALPSGTNISVYEGAVKVSARESGATEIIQAGQQTHFSKTLIAQLQTAKSARRSWVRGLLMADDISLAELIEEISPYHHSHINLSPALANLRVMGTYPLHNLDETLAMLSSTLPIRIEKPLPWWINIRPQ